MKPSEIIAMKANEQAQAVFEQGRIALQNGDHPLAIQQFEAALGIYPQNYDATHFLGIALAQMGQPQRAVSYFKQSLKLLPNSISAHNNLGQVLDDLQDYAGAIACFDKALAIDPNYAAALSNRADTLSRMPSTNIAATEPVPQTNQPKIDYLKIAIHLYERGDKVGALEQMEAWTRAEPRNAFAHFKRGILCKELRRYHEAVDGFSATLQLDPKNHAALYERGDILQYHELFELAEKDFAAAIALDANHSLGYEGMAGVQSAMGLLKEALATSGHALRLNPMSTRAQHLRYELLLDLREHDTLLAEAAEHVAQQPSSADAHAQQGQLLTHLRQFEPADAAFKQALRLDPQHVPAQQGLASLLYLQGLWLEAYKVNATANYASNAVFLLSFGKPIWTGEQDISGKTVLIYAELGQGDAVQLSRLASLVAKRGATVILKVPKSLTRLLGTLADVSFLLTLEEPNPSVDFVCSTLALPAIFGIVPSAIPFGAQPYIQVKPEWLEQSAQLRLPAKTKLRVGLVWGGGHSHYNYRRSVPLQQLMPILQNPSIEFFSFQKDRPRKELQALSGVEIIDLADQINDFADTAALLAQMDLLISVDTATAHVAGAMGKPVWMLTRRDHLWLEGRSDNPWYASMRMYTQTDFGNWDEVITRVQQDLHSLTTTP